VNKLENYADNWYTFLGMMDSTNQAEFATHLELVETAAFLKEQAVHY
jgi:hypothetical protein